MDSINKAINGFRKQKKWSESMCAMLSGYGIRAENTILTSILKKHGDMLIRLMYAASAGPHIQEDSRKQADIELNENNLLLMDTRLNDVMAHGISIDTEQAYDVMLEITAMDAVIDKAEEDFDNLYDGYGIFRVPHISQGLYRLLEAMMADENEWIEYYVYELESGKKWEKWIVTDKDGKDVPLGNVSDIWNILERNLEERIYEQPNE